jgi:hypothetical protein
MKKFTKKFSCVRRVLLTGVMAALAMSGYAEDYPKTISLYPTADIQLRKDNNSQNGDAASMEMRTGTAGSQDWAFVGGMKFSITLAEGEKVTGATLRLTAAQSSKDVVIYPFINTFGEVKGTDIWANYETEILEAVAGAPVVPAFRPNWGASKKIFEWTPIASPEAQRTIAQWQKTVDVTDYVVSKITGTTNDVGMLLGPSAGTTAIADPSIVFTKDVQLTDGNYGNSNTDQYDYTTAAKNGTQVRRWQRIQDLLDVDGSAIDQLYPMLTLTIEEDTGSAINAAVANKVAIDNIYYDLAGRLVSDSAKGVLLKKSVYDDGSVSYGKVYVK